MNLHRPVRRVLVLGGTGFLGSEVVHSFLVSGSSVAALARRPPTGRGQEWLASADMILGAAEDPIALARALHDVDHVVHALGCPLPAEANRDPVGDLAQTIPALIQLLEMLRSRPGVGLTFLSSGGTVYGNCGAGPVHEDSGCDPITAYGITKLTAEKYVGMYSELYQIPTRILRISNAYGPLQSARRGQGVVAAFFEAARQRTKVRMFGDGSVVRDYVYVADVAHAVVQLSRRADGPRVVNVGSGVGLSVQDVLDVVERTAATRLEVERRPQRLSDVTSIVLDVARLRGLVDWRPTPFEDGISRTWQARNSWSGRAEVHLA